MPAPKIRSMVSTRRRKATTTVMLSREPRVRASVASLRTQPSFQGFVGQYRVSDNEPKFEKPWARGLPASCALRAKKLSGSKGGRKP